MLTRRKLLLVGASALAINLFMPAAASAPPLDKEALSLIAECVRKSLISWSPNDRDCLFQYSLGRARTDALDTEWMSEKHVTAAVHRTLRAAFRALQMANEESGMDFPIFRNGRLTIYGQTVLVYLPIAPSDCDKQVLRALDRCAPHYLS